MKTTTTTTQWPTKPNDTFLKLNNFFYSYSSFALSCGIVLLFVCTQTYHVRGTQTQLPPTVTRHRNAMVWLLAVPLALGRMKASTHINSHSFGVFSASYYIFLFDRMRYAQRPLFSRIVKLLTTVSAKKEKEYEIF